MTTAQLEQIKSSPEYVEDERLGPLWYGPLARRIARLNHGWVQRDDIELEDDIMELLWMAQLPFKPDLTLEEFILPYSYERIAQELLDVYREVMTKQVMVGKQKEEEKEVVTA